MGFFDGLGAGINSIGAGIGNIGDMFGAGLSSLGNFAGFGGNSPQTLMNNQAIGNQGVQQAANMGAQVKGLKPPTAMESAFGRNGSMGWANGTMSGMADLAKMYGGMQQVKLGKEQLAFNRDIVNENGRQQADQHNRSVMGDYQGMPEAQKERLGLTEQEYSDKYGMSFSKL